MIDAEKKKKESYHATFVVKKTSKLHFIKVFETY